MKDYTYHIGPQIPISEVNRRNRLTQEEINKVNSLFNNCPNCGKKDTGGFVCDKCYKYKEKLIQAGQYDSKRNK